MLATTMFIELINFLCVILLNLASPFDHELIEFSFKIPSEIKLKDDNRKYILKKVAEEFLPSSILKSTKKGFRLPMGRFMQSTLKKTTQEKIEKLQSRELVNPDFVRTLYKSYSDGKSLTV